MEKQTREKSKEEKGKEEKTTALTYTKWHVYSNKIKQALWVQ